MKIEISLTEQDKIMISYALKREKKEVTDENIANWVKTYIADVIENIAHFV